MATIKNKEGLRERCAYECSENCPYDVGECWQSLYGFDPADAELDAEVEARR